MSLIADVFMRFASVYREILLFGVIGVTNTLVHSALVIMLVEGSIAHPVPANVTGFAVANAFSFLANSLLTFRRRPTWSSYWKFLQVSLLSLALTVFLSALAEVMGWHYLVGLLLVILCGPPLTFLLYKCYAFRHQTPTNAIILSNQKKTMRFNNLHKISGNWWSILLGFAAFLSITGGKILLPTYTDWLMATEGDPAQDWLGWQFFRYSPLLQWPLGANPNWGMDIGSSIVFTDSIPLLAFIFKPLNALLPDTFQYCGLWILICFLLQSLFAWKLLSLFTQDKWLPLIGSIFFSLAPVFLFRLYAEHYGLSGQWMLLAGLYLYFSKNFSIFRWMALLAVTALIHAYLLVMVLTIWSADLIQRRWLKQMGIVKTLSYFFAGSVCIAVIMWAAGYFMLGAGVGVGGFSVFRMNLLSLIDPGDFFSNLLPDQKGGGENHEGFNYLGLGMLGLSLIAAYELLRNVKTRPKAGLRPTLTPILTICIGFFLYAISNQVAVGPHEIFSYDLPPIIGHFTNAFRASGRLFWPVYYVIYLGIFYLLFTRLRRKVAITICLFMLVAQLIDSTDVWPMLGKKFAHSPAWSSPMRSPVWSDIAAQYKKIIYVLPHNNSADWMPLSHFAATHQMAINTGYFSRVNPDKEREARAHTAGSIVNNKLSPDSLYVFDDNILWKFASSQIASSDIAGIVDGFRIIAPNLKACKTCDTSAITSFSDARSHDFEYKMERIFFTSNGTGQKYQIYGWSTPEKWGTWSDGNKALMLLELSSKPQSELKLLIDGHALLTDEHPSQEVDILVNNQHVATFKYDQQSNNGVRVVNISKPLAMEKNGRLLIRFNFKDPKSPAELGLSTDGRHLGLGIVSLELRAEN